MDSFIVGCNSFIILNLFIIAVILWVKRNNSLSNIVLGIYIFLNASILVFNILTYLNYLNTNLYFLCIFPGLLIGPFAFLYCQAVLRGKQRVFILFTLVHFIPAIALTLLIGLVKYFLVDFPDHFLSIIENGPAQLHQFFRYFVSAHIGAYFLYTWHCFNKFRREACLNESDSLIRLSWLKDFILIITALFACFLLFHFLSVVWIRPVIAGSSPITPLILLAFYFLILKKSLSYSAAFNFNFNSLNTLSLKAMSSDFIPEEKPACASDLSEEQFDEIESKLNFILNSQRPYLDQELSVKKLSEMMDIPAKNLSHFINKRYQKNFKDFINYYRVEELKKMLLDPQNDNLKLEAIGEAAGFNSRANFFSIFKKVTGQTPASFKKDHYTESF